MFVIFNKTQYIKLLFPTKWKPDTHGCVNYRYVQNCVIDSGQHSSLLDGSFLPKYPYISR